MVSPRTAPGVTRSSRSGSRVVGRAQGAAHAAVQQADAGVDLRGARDRHAAHGGERVAGERGAVGAHAGGEGGQDVHAHADRDLAAPEGQGREGLRRGGPGAEGRGGASSPHSPLLQLHLASVTRTLQPPPTPPARRAEPTLQQMAPPLGYPGGQERRGPLPTPRRAEKTMGMPETAELWTAERIRALPDDGFRHEVVDGQYLATPAPRAQHQIALSELEAILRPYVKEHGLGESFHSPADLEFDPHTLMQPDLFVTTKRKVKTWTDALPLHLAVEVLSPSSARADRIVKRRRLHSWVPVYDKLVGIVMRKDVWLSVAEARMLSSLMERLHFVRKTPSLTPSCRNWLQTTSSCVVDEYGS